MDGYMPQILYIHQSDRVYHGFFSLARKKRIRAKYKIFSNTIKILIRNFYELVYTDKEFL